MTYRKVYEHDNPEYRAESLAYLRKVFPPGTEVRTIVRHVARSGMSRTITVLAIDNDASHGTKGRSPIVDVSRHVARLIGWSVDTDNGAVRVNGCGMDMCFHLVYTLAHTLYASDSRTLKRHSTIAARAGYLLDSRVI